jgi:hypothetical protein
MCLGLRSEKQGIRLCTVNGSRQLLDTRSWWVWLPNPRAFVDASFLALWARRLGLTIIFVMVLVEGTMMDSTFKPYYFRNSIRSHLGFVVLLLALFAVGMNPGYRRRWRLALPSLTRSHATHRDTVTVLLEGQLCSSQARSSSSQLIDIPVEGCRDVVKWVTYYHIGTKDLALDGCRG